MDHLRGENRQQHQISMRKFLFELSNQLRESEVLRKAREVVESYQLSGKLNKRVTCEVR